MVIVNFIRDREVGIFARAKRLSKLNAATVDVAEGKGLDVQLEFDKSD